MMRLTLAFKRRLHYWLRYHYVIMKIERRTEYWDQKDW